MRSRLDSVDRELSGRLEEAPAAGQRAAVAAAAAAAVRATALTRPQMTAIAAAIMTTPASGPEACALRTRVSELVDELDERAQLLHERTEQDQTDEPATHDDAVYETVFAQARAAAAVGYVLDLGQAENPTAATAAALDGVYEAYVAIGDLAELRRVVEPALEPRAGHDTSEEE